MSRSPLPDRLGRPPSDPTPPPTSGAPPVPTGIQQLLRLASVDADFCRELCERRAEVAAACGVTLTTNEQRMLEAIDATQLELMARHIPLPPAPRREFLRGAAASAAVLLGGAALGELTSACRPDERNFSTAGATTAVPPKSAADSPDAGVEPAPERPTRRETEAEGGISPELPPPRASERPMDVQGGQAPDVPPERPERPRPTRGIRPDIPPDGELF
jgi:hypothetical protein